MHTNTLRSQMSQICDTYIKCIKYVFRHCCKHFLFIRNTKSEKETERVNYKNAVSKQC